LVDAFHRAGENKPEEVFRRHGRQLCKSANIRVAASALVHRGQDAQSIRSIADLLSFERYQEILRFFLDRRCGQTSPQVGQMAAFLKDTARHWLKVDEPTLERFKKMIRRIES
jgi:hypothetical protein